MSDSEPTPNPTSGGNVVECDHEWIEEDLSFDHEYGTEVSHQWFCLHCDATRPFTLADYQSPFDDDVI